MALTHRGADFQMQIALGWGGKGQWASLLGQDGRWRLVVSPSTVQRGRSAVA